MLNRSNLHDYQQHCVKHIIENEFCGLFLDMGLGKTVSTLTAIVDLLSCYDVSKVLIIAPKGVAEHTWKEEVGEWEHTRHLRVSVITGDEKQRKAALAVNADIYTISRDNVTWIRKYYSRKFPFDMVIVDESSSFKSHDSKRFASMKIIRKQLFRLVCLTGTPSPNSLIDLWPQIYLMDQGERLGGTIGEYRQAYFKTKLRGRNLAATYVEIDEYKELIYRKIEDICISMKSEDWLELPEYSEKFVNITMPEDVRKKYEIFEEESVLEYAEMVAANTKTVEWYDPFTDEYVTETVTGSITALSAVALIGKLLQYAAGAVWKPKVVDPELKVQPKREFVAFHELKIDALEEILEAANGAPVLCFYNFKHDADRILHRLKKYNPRKYDGAHDIDPWNRGEFKLLLAHPDNVAYGLNMQKGGHIIVWFDPTWSYEKFAQGNSRLLRQGQKLPVQCYKLRVLDTAEHDVYNALERKEKGQNELMQAVKAKVDKYLKAART